MKKLLLSIIILVLAVSCQETEFTPVTDVEDDCLYCTMESISATKTSMDENNNVLWSEGDQLVAFMKSSLGSKYQIKDECVGSTNGGFSKVTEESSGDDLESGGEISHNVVLYPYTPTSCMKNDNNEPANSYKVNLNLPETQTYAVGSFGNGSFPMIAVSSSNKLLFKNICGGVKLQFKGEDKIKSIKLESIGGEKISGKATVIGYADGTAPATTMADGAASSVTLDCGDGVQLSDEPKTFIISVPPVVFESGMKITVTDTDGISRELTNESKNTVKRSSLLTFPVITYTQTGVFELAEGALTKYDVKAEGGTIEIPVVTNQDYQVVIPENAAEWITVLETKVLREETIALNVTENTNPEARSAEILIATTENVTLKTITINQEAGEQPVILLDYIDEFGVNHGKGTVIDGIIWAPVNCGYHETDFRYGKLYQWGRKYGQGYCGEFWYDLDGNIPVGTYSDASVPDFVEGPVPLSIGQSKDNENKCYYISGDSLGWCDSQNDKLWNSGSEESPVKTAYDPCPDGWRVPTYAELNMLNNDSQYWTNDKQGRYGYWVSGSSSYTSAAPQIFLPAAGYRSGYKSSSFSYDGSAGNRPLDGVYWSSNPDSMPVSFRNSNLICGNGRANGYSVRCVEE